MGERDSVRKYVCVCNRVIQGEKLCNIVYVCVRQRVREEKSVREKKCMLAHVLCTLFCCQDDTHFDIPEYVSKLPNKDTL